MFVENPLNGSALIFPTLEVFHIAGFAMMVGSIALVDFSWLGYGLRRQNIAELSREMAPWTLVGLVLTMMAGLLMYSSDPDMYYENYVFLAKMAALTAVLIFHYTTRRKLLKTVPFPDSATWVPWVSIVLWALVIAGGIFIAFV